jgi:hypothetical protein
MSAWANQLKFIFENIFNSGAVCLFATKPLIFPEAALSSEVVDSESTSIKLTLDKFAVGKKAALKFACFEFDIHEDRLTEVTPIPLALRKFTTQEESMHHGAFCRYGLKGAKPVEILRPVRAITFLCYVGFTIELHAL